MAHGLGGTRRSGLEPYAERFQAAGFHVLLFDYRNLGASEGEPCVVTVPRQQEDWSNAIRHASTIGKVALWGTSFSGGHVIYAAARHPEVVAISCQAPLTDGLSAFFAALRRGGLRVAFQATLLAVADAIRGALGLPPVMMRIAGPPGSLAFLNSEDSLPGFSRLSPPGGPTHLAARLALQTSRFRPITVAGRVRCPALIQICDRDVVTPVEPTQETARLLKAEVKHYDCGHFDVFFGGDFERAVSDQIDFFQRHGR